MRKRTKLGIMFDRIFNKIVKVDNIERAEAGLQKQKEALKELSDAYYRAEGSLKSFKDELEKNENIKEQLNRCFKSAKKRQDKEGAKEIYAEIELTLKRIASLTDTAKKQEHIVSKFKKAKDSYEREIRNLKTDLETMKAKNSFSKAVEEYSQNFGEFSEFDMSDVQKDIDIEFNASNARLQDYEEKFNIDKAIAEDKFEEEWNK